MRTAKRQQSQPVLLVTKKHEIFAQNSSAQRLSLQFIDKRDRKPITAQHFSRWRSGPDSGQRLVFFPGQHETYLPFLNGNPLAVGVMECWSAGVLEFGILDPLLQYSITPIRHSYCFSILAKSSLNRRPSPPSLLRYAAIASAGF